MAWERRHKQEKERYEISVGKGGILSGSGLERESTEEESCYRRA